MIDNSYVIEKDGTVIIPDCALNGMDISFFANNSDSPNLETNDGFIFITKRKIKKGEELTASYETYDYRYKKELWFTGKKGKNRMLMGGKIQVQPLNTNQRGNTKL